MEKFGEIIFSRLGWVRDYRLLAGGNWNNGANCGSRASNWNNSVLNLNSNNGCRAVADTMQTGNEYQRLLAWAGIQSRADA